MYIWKINWIRLYYMCILCPMIAQILGQEHWGPAHIFWSCCKKNMLKTISLHIAPTQTIYTYTCLSEKCVEKCAKGAFLYWNWNVFVYSMYDILYRFMQRFIHSEWLFSLSSSHTFWPRCRTFLGVGRRLHYMDGNATLSWSHVQVTSVLHARLCGWNHMQDMYIVHVCNIYIYI